MDKEYKIKCPYCQKEMYAEKSIFHEMGFYDLGIAKCIKCKNQMQLVYIPENDSMHTNCYEELLKESD